jgi:quercetin dioxygenase-like cupin family protein
VIVTRIADASPYEAPGHFDMRGLRLHGFDVSPSQNFWVGVSHFLPGGGAQSDAGAMEKVYVVIEGTMTITTDEGDTELHPLDSCYLAGGERRAIANRTNRPASMIVIMPHPDGVR